MFADAIAFHASSISINFLIPFNLRILFIKASMMIMVVIGNKILWSLMLSNSKTMKRLCSKSSSLSEFSK